MFVEHKLFAPLTFPSYLLLPNTVYEDLFYVKELRCNVCDFRSVYTHKFLMHHVDTYLVFPFSVSNTLALFPSPPLPLFNQIRGVNSFNLLGEWSNPLLIYNSSSDASGAQGSGSEATGNREWIYVVVSMLCLVVLALGALLVLWVYRHFCFHRRIKYVSRV